ncbi:MAG: TRAP transporter substrate-binding protein DctP [Thermodesulfobacteriota bacterium]|nr:TRAP transporter substrate-binding protein DctP [Thermodesulfobacteriota bacterium]
MMKKQGTIKKAVWMLAAVVTAVWAAGPVTIARADTAPKVVWKVGTLTPKGVGWAHQFETIMMPVIQFGTSGELKVKVYWGGLMGDDEDIVAKMRVGQLQAAGLTGQGATIACPEFAVVELPFLFKSYAEVDHIREKMWPEFDRLMQARGFKLLAWLDQDFDQIYSVKWSFTDLADFQKARFMTWYGTLEEHLLKSLNASPIPVNIPELAPSLRQGVADSLIAPALWMIATQLYPVVNYMVPLNIRYSPAVVVCTLDAWNGLSASSRAGLGAARPEMEKEFVAATRRDNAKAMDAMVKYGIVRVDMTDAQVETIRKGAVTVWDDQAGKLYSRELLDRILAHLDQYRSQNP